MWCDAGRLTCHEAHADDDPGHAVGGEHLHDEVDDEADDTQDDQDKQYDLQHLGGSEATCNITTVFRQVYINSLNLDKLEH